MQDGSSGATKPPEEQKAHDSGKDAVRSGDSACPKAEISRLISLLLYDDGQVKFRNRTTGVKEAIDKVAASASRGDVEFLRGLYEADMTTALDYFLAAEKFGCTDPRLFAFIGDCYLLNLGGLIVVDDPKGKALPYYERAIALGYAGAYARLAAAVQAGPQDPVSRGYVVCQTAYRQGVIDGGLLVHLGRMCASGQGVPASNVMALKFFSQAMQYGYPVAHIEHAFAVAKLEEEDRVGRCGHSRVAPEQSSPRVPVAHCRRGPIKLSNLLADIAAGLKDPRVYLVVAEALMLGAAEPGPAVAQEKTFERAAAYARLAIEGGDFQGYMLLEQIADLQYPKKSQQTVRKIYVEADSKGHATSQMLVTLCRAHLAESTSTSCERAKQYALRASSAASSTLERRLASSALEDCRIQALQLARRAAANLRQTMV